MVYVVLWSDIKIVLKKIFERLLFFNKLGTDCSTELPVQYYLVEKKNVDTFFSLPVPLGVIAL